jgi:hypothetical protein
VKLDRGILAALGAAALFGLSTPMAKALVGEISPLLREVALNTSIAFAEVQIDRNAGALLVVEHQLDIIDDPFHTGHSLGNSSQGQ